LKLKSLLLLIVSLILFFYSIQPVLAADKEETLPSEETEIKDDVTEQSQQDAYKNRREYIQHMMEEQRKKTALGSGQMTTPDETETPPTDIPATVETAPSDTGQE